MYMYITAGPIPPLNPTFLYKLKCWHGHPGFHGSEPLGSLSFSLATALSPFQILLSYPCNLPLANIWVTTMTERIKHPEMLQRDNTVVLHVDSGAYLLQS